MRYEKEIKENLHEIEVLTGLKEKLHAELKNAGMYQKYDLGKRIAGIDGMIMGLWDVIHSLEQYES